MSDKVFVDSNVFLYAVQQNVGDKSEQCSAWLLYLLRSGSGVANLQVMNEIANVLLKRGRLEPESVFSTIDGFASFGRTTINLETVAAGRLLHFESGYS